MIQAADYLDSDDLDRARAVGLERFERAKALSRSQPFGDPGDANRRYVDCWSALAECAVAKWLRLPWNDAVIDDLSEKPPDVGSRVEVRWTPRASGHLIGHASDIDGWIMVLVRRELPGMTIVGWTTTRSVKQPQHQGHISARNPADYWFPSSGLLMTDLLLQMRNSL